MQAIIDHSEGMQTLTLEKIEELWHDSGIVHDGTVSLDFDIDDEDYEYVGDPKDAVVHPATAIILLREYQKDADKAHLDQIKDELNEVLGHAANIEMSLTK